MNQKAKEGEQEVGAAVGGRAGRPQEGSVVSSWAFKFLKVHGSVRLSQILDLKTYWCCE